MNERFRYISFPLLKREMEPLLAYENRKESRTPKELALLNDNEHAIQMEGLIMRERILENGNKELCYLLKYREAFFADHGKYDVCIGLWTRAMEMVMLCDDSITKDLERFVNVFGEMAHKARNPSLQCMEVIFKKLVAASERLKEK